MRWLLGYLVFRDLNADMEQLARGLDIGVVASRYLRGDQLHLTSPPSIRFPVVFLNLDMDVHLYIYTIFDTWSKPLLLSSPTYYPHSFLVIEGVISEYYVCTVYISLYTSLSKLKCYSIKLGDPDI